jgi:hypothetical protein
LKDDCNSNKSTSKFVLFNKNMTVVCNISSIVLFIHMLIFYSEIIYCYELMPKVLIQFLQQHRDSLICMGYMGIIINFQLRDLNL